MLFYFKLCYQFYIGFDLSYLSFYLERICNFRRVLRSLFFLLRLLMSYLLLNVSRLDIHNFLQISFVIYLVSQSHSPRSPYYISFCERLKGLFMRLLALRGDIRFVLIIFLDVDVRKRRLLENWCEGDLTR